MKFARLGPVGAEIPVLVDEGRFFDLSGIATDINGDFLSGAGIASARAAFEAGTLPEIADASSQRLGSAIARLKANVSKKTL